MDGLGAGGGCVLLLVKLMSVLVLSRASRDLKAVVFRRHFLVVGLVLHVLGDLHHYTP